MSSSDDTEQGTVESRCPGEQLILSPEVPPPGPGEQLTGGELSELPPGTALEEEHPGPSAHLVDLTRRAVDRPDDAIRPSTRRAYAGAWRSYERWCARERLPVPWFPVREGVLVVYLEELADQGLSMSAIQGAVSALAWHHARCGHPSPSSSPAVQLRLAALRAILGSSPRAPRRPLSWSELGAMVRCCPPGLAGIRDRAVLLTGYLTGARRAELAALRVQDLHWTGEALSVYFHRTKAGHDHYAGLPLIDPPELCGVRALQRWRDLAQLSPGPLFRPVDRTGHVRDRALSGRDIARIVQRAAERAALPARELIGAHSMRRGLIVELRRRGELIESIGRHVGHRQTATTMGYARPLAALDASPLRVLSEEPLSRP